MPQTLSSDGSYRLTTGGANVSADGTQLLFTITGTNSLVLSKNTAPPGSAVNLVDVAYVEGNGDSNAAGTAITASMVVYVSAADAALDLWAVLNHTSGAVVVGDAQPIALYQLPINAPGSKFSLA